MYPATLRAALAEFDAIEVHPVYYVLPDALEPCDDNPEWAAMWSVYGHYRPSRGRGFGVQNVADFYGDNAEVMAREFAALCRAAIE